LCLRRYRRHSCGTVGSPVGWSALRSCGLCATEYDWHGGAANTKSYRPARTAVISLSCTGLSVTSCAAPPILVSTSSTSNPSRRRNAASPSGLSGGPANSTSALGLSFDVCSPGRSCVACGGQGGGAVVASVPAGGGFGMVGPAGTLCYICICFGIITYVLYVCVLRHSYIHSMCVYALA
jgi:hypothetical protein